MWFIGRMNILKHRSKRGEIKFWVVDCTTPYPFIFKKGRLYPNTTYLCRIGGQSTIQIPYIVVLTCRSLSIDDRSENECFRIILLGIIYLLKIIHNEKIKY